MIGVCGPPGSGKSSLLLAALGQMRMTSGQLVRQGSCAYVGQRAWLANCSVRESILFGEAYEPQRYHEAQVVCKLKEDVKRLPKADKTMVAEITDERMKQKIALARAFYANR